LGITVIHLHGQYEGWNIYNHRSFRISSASFQLAAISGIEAARHKNPSRIKRIVKPDSELSHNFKEVNHIERDMHATFAFHANHLER